MKEVEIQQAFRKHLYYTGPRIRVVAVPNGARRTQWEARQAKREGMATGFPDVICLWPGDGHAFIEFKAEKGRVSENQREWGDWLIDNGFCCCIARSVDEAVDFLKRCGAPIMERAA